MRNSPRALILAAGEGTRLRPHTLDRPKCMVELCGTPLLHRQLAVLRQAGVEDIVLVGGYRAERLDAQGARLAHNPRFDETNMVYTLFCAEDEMSAAQDLVISYGDIVFEPKVIASLLASTAPLTIAVDRAWRGLWEARMEDPLADAETLKLDGADQIVELGRKPDGYEDIQGQYMGLVKVRADHVDAFRAAWHGLDRDGVYDGKDYENMYMTSYLQHLIDTGWDARAAFTDGGWLEVDTVEDLECFERMEQGGRLASLMRLKAVDA